MKGIQVDHWLKGPDDMKVTEIPVPTPKEGELLIQVKAVGLNYFDILMVSSFVAT